MGGSGYLPSLPFFGGEDRTQRVYSKSNMFLIKEMIMFISTSEAIFMIICMGVVSFMLLMLFLANHSLLIKNRYLKQVIKEKNKQCMLNHAEVPF